MEKWKVLQDKIKKQKRNLFIGIKQFMECLRFTRRN